MDNATETTFTLHALYQTAHEKAIWVDLNAMGRLEALDRDRLDLINRLSTNKVITLQEGEGRATIFTTAIARIMDWVVVLNQGERVLIITKKNRSHHVLQWLKRNIFFNDQFQVHSVADTLQQIGIIGKESARVIETLWDVQLDSLPPYHFVEVLVAIDDQSKKLLVIRAEAMAGGYFWLVGERDVIQEAIRQLEGQNIPHAPAEVYDTLRIEAGIPEVEHELIETYIPLEIGLWDAVSFNKGCYIGQEIIARMESRGKLAKMLVKLVFDLPFSPQTALLDSEGKSVGVITSVAPMPTLSATGYVGLGVIRATHAESASELYTANQEVVRVMGVAGHYEANYS